MFCYCILCPPPFQGSNFPHSFSSSLKASPVSLRYKIWRILLFLRNFCLTTTPAFNQVTLNRELQDIVPGTSEPTTCSKSKSIYCLAIISVVKNIIDIFKLQRYLYRKSVLKIFRMKLIHFGPKRKFLICKCVEFDFYNLNSYFYILFRVL